jgi:hypothetical protein
MLNISIQKELILFYTLIKCIYKITCGYCTKLRSDILCKSHVDMDSGWFFSKETPDNPSTKVH